MNITTFTVILPELSIEQATEGDEFFGNASVTVIENVFPKKWRKPVLFLRLSFLNMTRISRQ